MSEDNVSVSPEVVKTPFSKMTKEQLVVEAERLTAQIATMETQLAFFNAPTSTAGRNKLSMEIAEVIRKEWADEGISKNALSLKYRVSRDTIMAILDYRIYKTVDPLQAAAEAEAKAKAQAEKEAKKEARAKAKAEKQTATAAEKQARAAAREQAKLEKAAAKAKAEEDGSGPVRDAKSARKVKAPAQVTSMTPEQKKAAAAEMRRLAYERAQKRVAAAQDQQETPEAPEAPVVEESVEAPEA